MDNIKPFLIRLEDRWGCRPHLVLACSGGTDEHWQIWNSNEIHDAVRNNLEMFPAYVSTDGGNTWEPHPDGMYGPIYE